MEAGQTLRDEAGPQLRKAGAGLWVLETPEADGGATETELLLTGRKVKAYTCACAAFAKTRHCAHLAALLALVRLSKLPRAIPRVARRPRTVTTKSLVERVPEADLRNFLIERARVDGELAAALRLHLAHHTNLQDRFGGVVKKLFARTSDRYSPRDLKRIGEGLAHFAKLRETWRAERAWVDLLELDTVLLEHLVVVLGRLDETRVDGRAYAVAIIDDLTALATAPAAPALLERLRSWLDEQLERGAYARRDLDGPMYGLLAVLPDGLEAAVEALSAALGQSPEEASLTRLRTYRRLLREADREPEADALLVEHLGHSELVLDALAERVADDRLREAAHLASAALERCREGELRTRLLTFYSALVNPTNGIPLVEAYAEELLRWTGKLEKALPTTLAPVERERLLLYLRERFRTGAASGRADQGPDGAAVLAELHVALADWPALEQLLYRHSDDIGLALAYLPKLAGHVRAEDLELLLHTVIGEQLDGRFGAAPAADATALLDAVARRDGGESVAKLVARLRRSYATRPALLEALTEAGF